MVFMVIRYSVGSFMIWLHSCPPAIAENEHYQVIINLAIFAETYQIHSLKNLTSDFQMGCESTDRIWSTEIAAVIVLASVASFEVPYFM